MDDCPSFFDEMEFDEDHAVPIKQNQLKLSNIQEESMKEHQSSAPPQSGKSQDT